LVNLLSANFQYITICIEDDLQQIVGTGFLSGDTPSTTDRNGRSFLSWERPDRRAYLVTARHVLGENASVIASTMAYGLRYNVVDPSGNLQLVRAEFNVKSAPPNWAIHPDPSRKRSNHNDLQAFERLFVHDRRVDGLLAALQQRVY
jgi:hypothetical protein